MSSILSSWLRRSSQRGGRWRSFLRQHVLLPCSIVAILATTLGLKVVHYTRAEPDPRPRQEAALDAFLQNHGWVRLGVRDLRLDGGTQAVRYAAASCAGEILVMVLSPVGQETGLAHDMVRQGEFLLFVDQGVVSETPPRYAPLKQRLGRLSESLHLSFFSTSPYLAIAVPAECKIEKDRIETNISWRSL